MLEKFVEWSGTKVAHACFKGCRFLAKQMCKDADRFDLKGERDRANAIRLGVLDLEKTIQQSEAELASCWL
jgi:hypothetical protein